MKSGKSRSGILMGVDLAISERDTACFTAIVSGIVYGYGDEFKVYILPNPINRRMGFPETLKQIKDIYHVNETIIPNAVNILVEEVGYQKAVVDQLKNENYTAFGVK